jgi:phosphoglycerol transferase MdoB-like AlkP superfamily enzyme
MPETTLPGSPVGPRPHTDRIRVAALVLAFAVGLGPLLRVALYLSFHDGAFRAADLALAIALGVVYDLVGFCVAMQIGLLLWSVFRIALLPLRGLARATLPFASFGSALDNALALHVFGFRRLRAPLLAVALGAIGFDAIAQWFFFEEFNARYNHIALDYLIYPHEVVGNINESYDLPSVFAATAAIGILACIPIARWSRKMDFAPLTLAGHGKALLVSIALGAVGFGVGWTLPAQPSENRIVSEIAHNGFAQLWRAFWTAHLDYEVYYATLPREVARTRAATMLGHDAPTEEQASAPVGQFTMTRDFEPKRTDQGYDVVVILEESFGSEFIGVLGHPERKTSPGFDRWSEKGILLTNLVATGNRTVRGMEGVLCSFPPLPPDSVVKRNHSDDVATIARVMKAQGCRTAFFYGGFGIFDSMKPFLTKNGYDEFVEQPDFSDDAFRTIWGVADEYVFDRMLQEQIESRKKGQRCCFTALSVSNHKPYRIPPGRIQELTPHPSRENAVAYADWALANYFDKARAAGVLEHTIVLAIADHGARVYGREEIPAASYRIPALILHPDPALAGARWNRLCSQIDLAPTLLSLAGVRCRAPFFGSDLTGLPEDGGRAFLQHNRDIGILTDRELVVLGLPKKTFFYSRPDKSSNTFTQVAPNGATDSMRERLLDATSVYQTAYELYTNERFRLR